MSIISSSSSSALGFLSAAPEGAASYQISRSVRFNSSDSVFLSRVFSSAGNRTTWTWSGWVKQGNLSTSRQVLFGGYGALNDTDWIEFGFDTNNFYYTVNSVASKSPAVFRDVSAWQHVTVTYNGSNLKWYSNGVEVHSVSTTGNLGINGNWVHTIGKSPNSGQTRYFDGYLADIHFIDGQALTPSSFGEFDTNGVWQPKAYTGSYGTNGFHLPFSDNSTAAALGTDTSGNGHTWTVNNISVTAGAGNDSLVDSPTNYGTGNSGGDVRGNYCTWNPLNNPGGSTFANGNLDCTTPGSGFGRVVGTIAISSGKWYWEVVMTTGTAAVFGFTPASDFGSTYPKFLYSGGGLKSSDYFVTSSAYGATFTTNDVIGVAIDLDGGTCTFYKNGVSQGQAFSGLSGSFVAAISDQTNFAGIGVTLNAGQRPFAYTAPSGFKALCTQNLPTPLIANGATAMDVKLYTGNGSTQTISGLNFSPDFVWIKGRSGATDHALYDVVRGTQTRLESNTTDAEATSDSGLTAFNSDGFALSTLAQVNTSSATYAAWTWDAGSSTVTNTQGSITSSVRASASSGFSVVTYTGNNTTTPSPMPTVGHGLNIAPSLIISKSRNNAGVESGNWFVWHTGAGTGNWLRLNTTDAAGNISSSGGGTMVAPTSTVFSTPYISGSNISGNNYVAYCFAPVAGYSSFGSYTGNGSADGPFVYTGFRPAFVMIKGSSFTSNWFIQDDKRNGYNVNDGVSLRPNLANAEDGVTTYNLDLLSNGFKLRSAAGDANTSGATFIWAAFASNPFATARAR